LDVVAGRETNRAHSRMALLMTGKTNRRIFLSAAALAGVAGLARAASPTTTRAILFDAFAMFDPRSIVPVAERELPGQGQAFADRWRATQFQYSWIRGVAEQYRDFTAITEDALSFAAKTLKLKLTKAKRARLMRAYHELEMYPDVPAGIEKLHAAGITPAMMTNLTGPMMQSNLDHAGLKNIRIFSTEGAKTFKPHGRAYQLGVDGLRLPKEQIVFAAFGGWDAAGAKWFGLRTFWMNRFQQPEEQLGVSADATGPAFADLIRFATA
jgi:2-haloacid dehalogenase